MAHKMSNNLFLDNLLMTTDLNTESAFKLYSYPKETFTDMGMNLCVFTTNSKERRKMIPIEDRSEETTPKVLGIPWDIDEDQLVMKKGTMATIENVVSMSDFQLKFPTEKAVMEALLREGYFEQNATCCKCGLAMSMRSRGDGIEVRKNK
uniref:Uncharacterized protein n=1 Tax=Caenorhabditis japonica TaxID=281687 RepID=A0A8R1IMQ3_CAEJA